MKHQLRRLLQRGKFPQLSHETAEHQLRKLQLRILRAQQGIFHGRQRALILLEGFDAAGKGGLIQRLVQPLDPRGARVHAFGPPNSKDQSRHYLYRFWKCLPEAGQIAIFDRTWYGRVLVEKVEGLAPEKRLAQAYDEINATEQMLVDDGIDVIKIFLAIDADEQLRRFEQRVEDPYKQWKLTEADIEARTKWDKYVAAADKMFKETDTKTCPWHLIAANDKDYARVAAIEVVAHRLGRHAKWMESTARKHRAAILKKALRTLRDKP